MVHYVVPGTGWFNSDQLANHLICPISILFGEKSVALPMNHWSDVVEISFLGDVVSRDVPPVFVGGVGGRYL